MDDPAPIHAEPSDVWPYPLVPEGSRSGKRPRLIPPDPSKAPPNRWGICLSGGGIRSASFCLGALQAMQRRSILYGPERDRATYLSAVSGGSYIAGAYALLAHQLSPGPEQGASGPAAPMRDVPPFSRPLPCSADPPANGGRDRPPVTPEERYLCDHTLYLSHGPGRAPGAFWHLTLGILINLLLLGLVINALARPLGWLAGRLYPSLRGGAHLQGVHTPAAGWLILGTLVAASLVAGLASVLKPWREGAPRAEWASMLLLIAAGICLAVLGLPYLLVALRGLFRLPAAATTAATADRLKVAAGAGGVLSLGTGLAHIRRLWAAKPKLPSVASKGLPQFLNSHRSLLLNLAAALAGPLLIGGTFLVLLTSGAGASAAGGARYRADVIWWAAALFALVGLWFIADLNAWSPHSFYYKRLASMFAIGRQAAGAPNPRLSGRYEPSSAVQSPDGSGQVGALPYRYQDADLSLGKFKSEMFPEILICAAANVRDYGSVPTGFDVTSFVFSPRSVGGPLVGAVPTTEYEHSLGDLTINLPEAVSLAGAAVAPEMGKMTRGPLRFLMTLANVRLGAWVINPSRLDRAKNGQRKPPYPRPTYLFREMFGLNHLGAPYLYVTDGGHYENLGLVEQLRRGCSWVFCVDAAGDSVTTFHTLGQAIAIARAELGIRIDIHPAEYMAPPPAQGGESQDPAASGGKASSAQPWVGQAYCFGTIHYPDRGEPGALVYVKAGVPVDAPWDVKNYALMHPGFPCDPTLDQFYDAERLGAYRALGEFVTEQALDACWESFSAWRKEHPAAEAAATSGTGPADRARRPTGPRRTTAPRP